MNNSETSEAIQFLNTSWPQKPMPDATARIWGAELAKHESGEVMAALIGLARTAEWRPSLAAILKSIRRARNAGAIGSARVHESRALGEATVSKERADEMMDELAERLQGAGR